MAEAKPGTAFVAGATGALGGRIALRLIEDGWVVHASGRNGARLSTLAAAGALRHEWTDRAADLPPGVDVIINAAGIGGGTRDKALLHASNVAILDPLIAAACAASKCLLIQLSTPATQFTFEDRIGIRENDPFTSPISPYAASKQEAERILRAKHGLQWCILRLRAGYGHRAPSMVEDLRARVRSSVIPLVKGGRAMIDLVHADDIADAVAGVAAARNTMAGVTANIAGPEALTFKDIVETLAAAEMVRPRFASVPAAPLLAAAIMMDGLWRIAGWTSEPPLTRHVAGSLVHSQTLDLNVLAEKTGWRPSRRFIDHAAGV
jgi:2-alkyl-3-oxoalkanoate reductase